MGFLDSSIVWLLVVIIAFILFAVFSYYFELFYHRHNGESSEQKQIFISKPETPTYHRKLVGLFILIALIIIMSSTGINMFLNKTG